MDAGVDGDDDGTRCAHKDTGPDRTQTELVVLGIAGDPVATTTSTDVIHCACVALLRTSGAAAGVAVRADPRRTRTRNQPQKH